MPEPYLEHLYRKTYGLSAREYLDEPLDRIYLFEHIYQYEQLAAATNG